MAARPRPANYEPNEDFTKQIADIEIVQIMRKWIYEKGSDIEKIAFDMELAECYLGVNSPEYKFLRAILLEGGDCEEVTLRVIESRLRKKFRTELLPYLNEISTSSKT